MLENTENTTPVEPTIEELKTKVAQLEQRLVWAEKSRDNYLDTCNKATAYIQASIDREEWTEEELDEIFWEELAEILDLELTKAIDIEITARWTATVRIKRGQSLDDLDISVDEPEAGHGVELENLYQRDFDIEEA
jgi:hypothetical protein